MLRLPTVAILFFALTMNTKAGALLDAVKAGDLSEVDIAISQGADVNEKTGFLTPLIAAILAENYEMADLLVGHGADTNKGAGANIPLFMAAGRSNPNFVQLLLENGADARFAANGSTALHRAAEAGVAGFFQIEAGLERQPLQRGADLTRADADGVARQARKAHRTGPAELDRSCDRAVMMDPPRAARPVHAAKGKELAGNELPRLIGT